MESVKDYGILSGGEGLSCREAFAGYGEFFDCMLVRGEG